MQQIDPSISKLASSYVAYLCTNDESLVQASFDVIDLTVSGPWESLWQLVQALAMLPDEADPVVLATIAAGPLEGLLDNAGPEYIDAVEALAGRNPRAARMLTAVWPSSIDPAVWQRVVAFCRKVPDPIDETYAY